MNLLLYSVSKSVEKNASYLVSVTHLILYLFSVNQKMHKISKYDLNENCLKQILIDNNIVIRDKMTILIRSLFCIDFN